MTEPDFSHLARQHTLGDDAIPAVVVELAGGHPIELVWRNDLGGLTFCIGDRFVKWNPRHTDIDLERERGRLQWLASRHPAPTVRGMGSDDQAQWLITAAVPGEPAVGDTWRARRPEAIRAIATGLRALHAIDSDDFPTEWTSQVWVGRQPPHLEPRPGVDRPVLVHGDACAPNTLIPTPASGPATSTSVISRWAIDGRTWRSPR